MVYTLGQAAKACGMSKATLSKAVKSGKISASKNDDGSFSIEAVELHRVYPIIVYSEQLETPKSTPINAQISNDLMLLQVKLDAAEKRISDLETDRDAWKGQATRLLTHQPTGGGFFRKLFGK
jgi:hypothetical protein